MYLSLITNYVSRDIAPYVEQDRCLNYRKQNHCHRCFNICPAKAISRNEQIKIDENVCKGCGICTAACPTKCLQLPNIDWLALYKSSKKLDHIQLGCLKSKSPSTTLIVPCLGSVPADFIAALSITGNKLIEIDLEPCLECENRRAVKQLYRTFRKSKIYADNRIRLKAVSAQKLITDNQNYLNHKNFSLLKRNFKQLINSVISNTIGEYGNKKTGENGPDRNRTILADILNDNPGLSIQKKTWQVSPKCNGCGFCRGSCPGNALEFNYIDNQLNIIHYPLKCTSCNFCANVCPRKALTETIITLTSFSANCQVIYSLDTKKCSICNQPFIYNNNHSIFCSRCTKRNQIRDSFLKKLKEASSA